MRMEHQFYKCRIKNVYVMNYCNRTDLLYINVVKYSSQLVRVSFKSVGSCIFSSFFFALPCVSRRNKENVDIRNGFIFQASRRQRIIITEEVRNCYCCPNITIRFKKSRNVRWFRMEHMFGKMTGAHTT